MAIIHDWAVKRAISGADLREKEGCAVKKNANGELVLAGATDTPLGLVHVGGNVGEPTDYVLLAHSGIVGGRISAELTAGAAEGAELVVAADGTLTTGEGVAIATCQEAAVKGQLAEVTLHHPVTIEPAE